MKIGLSQKEKAQALLDILSWAHADQYAGLDDEMSDDCDEWISNLTDKEVSDICISIFKNGI